MNLQTLADFKDQEQVIVLSDKQFVDSKQSCDKLQEYCVGENVVSNTRNVLTVCGISVLKCETLVNNSNYYLLNLYVFCL